MHIRDLERLGGSSPLQRRRTSFGKELRESYPCLLVYTCGLSCALHIASVAFFLNFTIVGEAPTVLY